MAEDKTAQAVSFIEKTLKHAGLADVRVVLFGSRALATASAGSDVDIAIVSGAFRGKDIFERARLTKDAELQAMKEFGLPFDILTLTPEEFAVSSLNSALLTAASRGSAR